MIGQIQADKPGKCHGRVFGGWRSRQCSRPIKITEDGHGYCTQHTPSVVKARRAKSYAETEAKWDRKQAIIRTERQLVFAVIDAEPDTLPQAVKDAVFNYRKVRKS